MQEGFSLLPFVTVMIQGIPLALCSVMKFLIVKINVANIQWSFQVLK